jgi:catechol 2,3-dioxygenase-like lactoylglutathione lyase family enzyme
MIVGADHLSLSCADVDSAAHALVASGYRLEFLERDLPNPPAKRWLLHHYRPLHSLAYCSFPSGLSIELTQHGTVAEHLRSGYAPLLDAPPPGAQPTEAPPRLGPVWQAALGCDSASSSYWPALRACVWHGAGPDAAAGARIRGVLVAVAELEAAVAFWQHGLGLEHVDGGTSDAGTRWGRLALRSLRPEWRLDIVLAETAQTNQAPPLLDDAGFPCLALLTTNLERDLAQLDAQGARVTEPFRLVVNQRPLDIAMVVGNDGELLELIQAAPRTDRAQRGPQR